ncbi:hypothetical protein [Lacipirellula sp.]|uniref:hypothetical protein n=1 Tax=Lacipirellula sp. TaxID=2691419 RepID=UPI003D0AC7E8
MSERMTTIVSALVALGILGLGVTAQPTGENDGVRVESLASDVRFQIEMSWRHDGRTRTARQAELEQTLAAFEKSPQSPADSQLLEQWLRAAVVASLPGESGKFPATPTFGKPAVVAELPATDSPAPATAAVPSAKAPATQPAQPPRDVTLKPNQAYTPPRAKEIRLTPRSQQANAPAPPDEASQRIVAAKPVVPAPSQTPAPAEKPRVALAEETPRQAPPAPTPPVVAAAQQPRASENAQPLEKPQGMKPVVPAPTAVAEQSPPAAAPAETEPKAIVDATPTTPSTPRVAAKPPAVPPVPVEPVTVNLAELNAQIRGYHEGLDEIDATIVARRGRLSEGEIARFVEQLEQLAGHHSFVRLYYDGLSKSERRFVAAPRALHETVDLVRNELAALNAEEEDFLTSLEGAAEEDELTRRLDALTKDAEQEDSEAPAAKGER